jgi:hypothetical protein
MSRQDADGAVDLLEQHHANELVRPSGCAECQPQSRLVAQARGESVVTADDENRSGPAFIAPSRQPRCQSGAVETLAALIEDDNDRPIRDDVRKRDRFFDHALADLLGAALADLDDVGLAEADAPSCLIRALAIALGKFALGAVLQPADGRHHQPHRDDQSGLRPRVPAHIFSRS